MGEVAAGPGGHLEDTAARPEEHPAREGSISVPSRAAVLGLTALLAACAGHDPGRSSPGAASTSFEWGGLRLRVELPPSPHDRIRVRGTLTNLETSFLERDVPRCVVMLRLYRRDRRAWSDGPATGCFGTRIVRLRPGESRPFHRSIGADRILGDSLPPGRYLVRAFWPGRARPGLPRAEIEVTLGDVELEPG